MRLLSLLSPCVLLAASLPAAAQTQGVLLEVRPDGVHAVPVAAATAVSTERWREDDLGLAWVGEAVAIGDSGAAMVGGKNLNNESVAVYGTGSGTPIFDASVPGANNVRVALAARAPIAAALVTEDIGGGVYQSTLHAYDTVGSGTPLFSATLPSTGNVIAGAVGVSDDGNSILAVVSNASGVQNLRVFDAAGTPTSTFDLPLAANLRFASFDGTGKRLYLGLFNGTCEIYETATGTLLHTQALGGTFDSHAFSADGKTFAYGNFSGLFVVRETAPGVWTQVGARFHGGGEFLGRCGLSDDGGRVAFAVQRYTPAYDHLELGMFDVPSGTDLWSASIDAPGTAFQLVTSGAVVSAAGDVAAFGSWGDDASSTPTILAYDEAGTQTAAVTTPGSVLAVDLDADGDVVAAGSKAVHANTFGNGGSFWCVDAADPTLSVLGDATVGGSLTLESPAGATAITVGLSSALGASPSAFGTTEIDLGALITTVGPLGIGPGGLSQVVNVPPNPALAGSPVHFQGLRDLGATSELTNKVSIRLRP